MNKITLKKHPPKNQAQRKKKLIEALIQYHGIVSTACKAIRIDRETYYGWTEADPDFKVAVTKISDNALDFVESKLLDNIEAGNIAAQIFYLKCKGKSRGFIERQEVHNMGGVQIEFVRTVKEKKPVQDPVPGPVPTPAPTQQPNTDSK